MSDADFASLPRFDAHTFEPPAWALNRKPSWDLDKNGESSDSATKRSQPGASTDEALSDKEDEIWQDAEEGDGETAEPWDAAFTTAELRTLLDNAVASKAKGNSAFTSKPANHDGAIELYQEALRCLPSCPKRKDKVTANAPPRPMGSGIQEVSEEEASAIEAEQHEAPAIEAGEQERKDVEEEIRECTKSCWGNLAACHLAKGDDKAAADACTKALAIDPHYLKALHRRATANDHIGSWSSLTTAQDDYKLLLQLAPAGSSQAIIARKALASLPERLRQQQEKEKDEMLGKLKELGNGLLGKFGLSTDMFKFDQQEGGGYNMRFER